MPSRPPLGHRLQQARLHRERAHEALLLAEVLGAAPAPRLACATATQAARRLAEGCGHGQLRAGRGAAAGIVRLAEGARVGRSVGQMRHRRVGNCSTLATMRERAAKQRCGKANAGSRPSHSPDESSSSAASSALRMGSSTPSMSKRM